MGWHFADDPPDERTLLEAEGGRAQARLVRTLIRYAVRMPGFRLIPGNLCDLHRLAMAEIMPNAGRLRERSDLEIAGSRHVLPPHEDVPRLAEDLSRLVLNGTQTLRTFPVPVDDGSER